MKKKKEVEYTEFDCKLCGEHERNHWLHWKELLASRLCFNCHFWQEKVDWREKNDPCAVVVKGVHYYICSEDSSLAFRGYGGSQFIIKFHDGRLVKSTNLWCQGDIPAGHFRDILTDNAVFIHPTYN